ncbi:MAG: CHASE2 domain-containing protein [Halioglobus sp.]
MDAIISDVARHPIGIFRGRLLLVLFAGLFCFALTRFEWVAPLDRVVYDLYNELLPLPPADDLVLVAIDESSLGEVGRWPWPREMHVEVLRQLRQMGARAVAIDILFSEPYANYPEVDVLLAQAIGELNNVVLPVFIGKATAGGELWEVLPVPPLSEAAAALGHVHIEVAADGVARETFLYEGLGEARWPHFALALAGVTGVELERVPGQVAPGFNGSERRGVIVRSHANLVRFMGPARTLPRLSFVDVMKGRVPAEAVRDKIVFVGATAAGHVDNITTSLGQIPGVEVNANIFQGLRTGNLAVAVDRTRASWLSLVLVSLVVPLFLRLQPRPLLAAVGICVLLIPAVSLFVFSRFNLWFSPVPVVVTFLLTYPLWNWLRLAAAVDLVHEQLAQLEHANRRLSVVHRDQPSVSRGADPVEDVLNQLDRAHREAQYNQELVQQTVEEMSSGVILAELGGAVLLTNHKANELLQIGEGDALGDIRARLAELAAQGGSSIGEALDELAAVGDRFSSEISLRSLGREVLLQGGVIGLDRPLLIFVLTDITQLKESEKQRAEALNFLSHDLRAPLTSVLALIESARDDSEGTPMEDLLPQVETYIRTNLSYAEDFIQLARMDHAATSGMDICDSASLVDNAVSQLFHSAARRGIDIRIEYCENDDWVYCDRHLVERALTNLIDNALKHSPEGGEVRVIVRVVQACLTFTISDLGPGIPEVDLSRIFTAFEQGDNAREGVGLGLRFVSVVAHNHGGSLEVRNNDGAGCSFSLRLPLAPGEVL